MGSARRKDRERKGSTQILLFSINPKGSQRAFERTGDLCSKGYSRTNEYDAHISSYDHQHKRRLKDMKAMQRDPNASTKARRSERKADEQSGLISIKPLKLGAAGGGTSTGAGGATGSQAARPGFKKSGFRNAFAPVEGAGGEDVGARPTGFKKAFGASGDIGKDGREESEEDDDDDDDDDDGVDYECYDPRRPTGCDARCRWREKT